MQGDSHCSIITSGPPAVLGIEVIAVICLELFREIYRTDQDGPSISLSRLDVCLGQWSIYVLGTFLLYLFLGILAAEP